MAPPTSIVWTTSRSGVVVPSRTVVDVTLADASGAGTSRVTGATTPPVSCVKSRPACVPLKITEKTFSVPVAVAVTSVVR